MMQLISHPVAATERHSSQKLSPHPDAIQIKKHGETRQTCETYWRTKQNMQDRSTGHGGAHQYATITVTPDTLKANPTEPDMADKTRMNRVVIKPGTKAPHTPYASLIK